MTAAADERLASRMRRKLDSWRVIVIFGIVYAISQAMIIRIVRPLGSDVLKIQTTLSSATFIRILHEWRAAGLVPVYMHHFDFDFVHPLWYGLLLAALLAKTFNANRVPARFDALLFVPFVAAALDLVENVFHVAFITHESLIRPGLVVMSGIASNTKWALAGLCVLAVIALAIRAFFLRSRARRVQ